MKTQYWLINSAIIIVLIAIGFTVTVKYIIPKAKGTVAINEINKIMLSDVSGTEIPMRKLIDDKTATYCLIFGFNDCYSCIAKGVEDLKKLKADGYDCLAIMIHDNLDDASGWSATQSYSPFFVLKNSSFYHYFRTPITPVIIRIQHGKVDNYYFLKP